MEAEENAASRTENNPEEQRRQREMHQRMDIDDSDIVVAGANPTRISRKQVSAFIFVELLHDDFPVGMFLTDLRAPATECCILS